MNKTQENACNTLNSVLSILRGIDDFRASLRLSPDIDLVIKHLPTHRLEVFERHTVTLAWSLRDKQKQRIFRTIKNEEGATK